MVDLHYCRTVSDELYIALAHQPGDTANGLNYSHPADSSSATCLVSSGQRGLQEHRSFEVFLREDREAIITLHLESYTGSDGARQLRDLFRRAGCMVLFGSHRTMVVIWLVAIRIK